MLGSIRRFLYLYRSQIQRFRFVMPAQALVGHGQVVKRCNGKRMVGVVGFFHDRQGSKFQGFGLCISLQQIEE